jgi:hypothetical protein
MARIIYYARLANGELVLLLVYAKAKFDNLQPDFLLKLNGLPVVEIGSLVADIGGTYVFIGAGTNTFTAWNTGELLFNYADENGSAGDDSVTVVSTVTVVAELASLALLALGLFGLAAARRRKQ